MKLKELKERIGYYSHESYDDLEVCIPNNKSGMMGGTPTTSVKSANRGIDWDSRKFIIWPETKLIEFQEDPADYVGFINYIRRETGMSKALSLIALEQCKEEIGNIISNWLRAHGKKTSEQSKIDAHYNSTDDYDSAQYPLNK
jgi:hypothetical protein